MHAILDTAPYSIPGEFWLWDAPTKRLRVPRDDERPPQQEMETVANHGAVQWGAMLDIDVSEDAIIDISPQVLELLLVDRTTGGNIIWATDHYAALGDGYDPSSQITVSSITGTHQGVIRPRVEKSKEQRWDRTKDKAEVFTPSWLCNEQNNRVDDAWFGRSGVFNRSTAKGWDLQPSKVDFEPRGRRTWRKYVDERRMEAACGEAPYLVSRYDAATGEPIELERRIGLLDRKLRVVSENAADASEWRAWARRAFESIYGFEYQGDSLLLARENLLASYTEYSLAALGQEPSSAELVAIASVISWNVWQMDARTGRPPLQALPLDTGLLPLFGDFDDPPDHKCVIRDWRAKKKHTYSELAS